MATQIIVYKKRVKNFLVSTGIDLSEDTLTSEIRVKEDPESELIATVDVNFATDGTDGDVYLTIDLTETEVVHFKGYIDVKRVSGGEPYALWDDTVEVIFKNPVTQ